VILRLIRVRQTAFEDPTVVSHSPKIGPNELGAKAALDQLGDSCHVRRLEVRVIVAESRVSSLTSEYIEIESGRIAFVLRTAFVIDHAE
jgi:hypothetical protein